MNRTTAAAHTPIPWEVDIGVTQISIRGYDGHTVCIDTSPERGREEIIANYKLICNVVNRTQSSLAHEALLKASSELIRAWNEKSALAWQPDGHFEYLDHLRSAIAKANA